MVRCSLMSTSAVSTTDWINVAFDFDFQTIKNKYIASILDTKHFLSVRSQSFSGSMSCSTPNVKAAGFTGAVSVVKSGRKQLA